jgi:hypothetical protein
LCFGDGEKPLRDTIMRIMGDRLKSARTRKIITRLLVFLLLGAVINTAVAWLCTLRCDLSRVMITRIGDDQAIAAMPVRSNSAVAPLIGVTGQCASVPGVSMYSLYAFHREAVGEWPIRYANQLNVVQAGWPLRSMQGWWGFGRTPREMGRHGLWHPVWFDRYRRVPGSATDLPTLPRWPGFAINTMLYAALLWLSVAVPRSVRRWLRVKEGLCPVCRYPIGSSPVCTECGRPVKVRGLVQI